ncbi:MAG: hypothetical protein QOC70_506 [Verrucomicrobiota bacterium]|jgi:hypothetical protein
MRISVCLFAACGALLFTGVWNTLDGSSPKQVELFAGLFLKPLLGAAFVAFAFGRKGYRLFVFSILCAAGALVFACFCWTEGQHRRQTAQLDTSIRELHQQTVESAKRVAKGEDVVTPQMKATGDAKLDAAFTIPMNGLFQDAFGYLDRMEAEVTGLQQEDVFSRSVLTKQASIDAETRKRIKSQEIIARYKKGFRPMIDSARVKFLSTMKATDDVKLAALKGFDDSMRVQVPQLEEMYSLRLRRENTELTFLLFMRSNFADYAFAEKTISFKNPSNSKKYNELVQGIQDASKDTEAYQKRQLEAMEAAKAKFQQLSR